MTEHSFKGLATAGLLGAVTLAGCASQQKEGPAEEPIAVRIDRVLPKAKSLDASLVTVRLDLGNPRKGPVRISKVDYEVDTGDVAGVLQGSVDSGATMEAGQTVELEFEQEVPFPDDVDAYQAVLGRGTLQADVRGRVFFSDGTSVPFERPGQVATPTLPIFVVHDAQAARYGEEGLDVTFFLRLINENVFTVTIEQVDYTIAINGKDMRSETAGIGVRLIQGGAEEYEVSTVLDETSFGKEALTELENTGRLTYKVTGKVSIPRLVLPFEHDGEIVLAPRE